MDNQDYWLSGIFIISSYQAKQWKKGSSKPYLYLRLLALLTAKPTVTLHPLRVIKAFIKFSPFGTLDVRVCAPWQEKNGLRVSQQQQQIKNNVNDQKKKITKLKKTPLDIVTSSFPYPQHFHANFLVQSFDCLLQFVCLHLHSCFSFFLIVLLCNV